MIELKPLPKQDEFLSLKATHNLLVSGYGFGKTETKIMALLLDMNQYGHHKPTFALYDPTYDLITLNTLPRILERLEQLGVKYKYNDSKKIIYTSLGKIVLRSMDTPARIIAYECFRSYIDELETLRPKQIIDVWNKINGRNRQKIPGGKNRTYTFTTTDAGYGFTYNLWGKPGVDKSQFDYVRASTRDNPHLPDDYVKNLEVIYPEGMVKAFIDGYWTNILSGQVYEEYERVKFNDSIIPDENDKIRIGQDFNTRSCISIMAVLKNGILYVIGEMISNSTDDIKSNYDLVHKNKAIIYPDASGNNASTNATHTDIQILENAGFSVDAELSNPRISERTLSVNSAFKRGLIRIDTEKAPKLAEALEKQAYDANGKPEKSNDHPSLDDYTDAFGYMVFKLFPIARPATPINFKFSH